MGDKANSIGEFIKQLAEEQNLGPTAFGKKINTSLQNAKDIFKRTSIDSELLLGISKSLTKNAFAYYDSIEPIKSIREAERADLVAKITTLEAEKARLEEKVALLESHLANQSLLVETQKNLISELQKP